MTSRPGSHLQSVSLHAGCAELLVRILEWSSKNQLIVHSTHHPTRKPQGNSTQQQKISTGQQEKTSQKTKIKNKAQVLTNRTLGESCVN